MKTIYLTGIPAVGKSFLTQELLKRKDNVKVISYSQLIIDFFAYKHKRNLEHNNMRTQSSNIISPRDIEEIDKLLIRLTNQYKKEKHVIIDSHAITKENYGFRSTPFKTNILKALKLDMIVVLYSNVNNIKNRIKSNPEGRSNMTDEEITIMFNLQNSLAQIYGNILNKPVYFLNSDNDIDTIREFIIKKLDS